MNRLGAVRTDNQVMTTPTAEDVKWLISTLPEYDSVTEAAANGVEEGEPYILHTLLGLSRVKIIAIK